MCKTTYQWALVGVTTLNFQAENKYKQTTQKINKQTTQHFAICTFLHQVNVVSRNEWPQPVLWCAHRFARFWLEHVDPGM